MTEQHLVPKQGEESPVQVTAGAPQNQDTETREEEQSPPGSEEGNGDTTSSEYDGSSNARIYPNSLITLAQAIAAKERMAKRVAWILNRHAEIQRECQTSDDAGDKQKLIKEDEKLVKEFNNLKDKRPQLEGKLAELERQAAAQVDKHQFEDISWA